MSGLAQATCRHCAQPIVSTDGEVWAHAVAEGSTLIRRDPKLSGQPYGLDAEPAEAVR